MTEAARAPIHGVTLAQFAFVRAGLAEGLASEDLLALFDIDPIVWDAADEAWDDRVLDAVGDVDTGFLDELAAATAEARTHWTRQVPPLDEDLRAWVDFVHALAEDPEPQELLARLGLGTEDVAHLQRVWGARLQADADVRARMLALQAEERRPPPVPEPQAPRLVRPPPASAARNNATAEIPAPDARTLPFEEGDPVPTPRPPLAVPLPRRRPRARVPGLDQTLQGRPAPQVAILPFADGPGEVGEPPPAPREPKPLEPIAVAVPPMPAPVAAAMDAPRGPLFTPAPLAPTLELPEPEKTLELSPGQRFAPAPDLDETAAIRISTGAVIPIAEAFRDEPAGAEVRAT